MERPPTWKGIQTNHRLATGASSKLRDGSAEPAMKQDSPDQIAFALPRRESVPDYLRPTRIDHVKERVCVRYAGVWVVDSVSCLRVVETSIPPVYYVPTKDVKCGFLSPMRYSTTCEWKGIAHYWTLSIRGRISEAAAWSYSAPSASYEQIAGYIAFYASRVDQCYVGDQIAQPQSGDDYGGWVITHDRGEVPGRAR